MHLYIDAVFFLGMFIKKEIIYEGFQNNEIFYGVLKLSGVT
jgi:hypothetical protein